MNKFTIRLPLISLSIFDMIEVVWRLKNGTPLYADEEYLLDCDSGMTPMEQSDANDGQLIPIQLLDAGHYLQG